MSVGEAYTLGVRLTGDLSDLRQELAQGRQLVQQWSTASVESMNTAAAAINRASAAMEAAAAKTAQTTRRSQQEQQSQTKRTATAYEEYMRRVTAAEKQVAATSKEASAQTTSALGSIGSTLGRLTGYAGFGLLAKQVWDTGVGFHEFTQNTQVALATLLGTDAAAKDFLATILEFAKTTPYAFTDLTAQAQKLITYGFQTEQIVPILTAVGDAATGMGKGVEGIDNIIRALGQTNTKGRLQSEELLQLSENGVNGLKILANQAGMTTLEYQKLITKGLIPAETAIAGIVTGMEEGTDGINGQTAAFGGLMEKIKGSGGITATLDSARTGFRNAAAAVTDSLVPAYTGFLGLATQGLGVVKDTANVFNGLPAPLQNSALAFVAATTAVEAPERRGSRRRDLGDVLDEHPGVEGRGPGDGLRGRDDARRDDVSARGCRRPGVRAAGRVRWPCGARRHGRGRRDHRVLLGTGSGEGPSAGGGRDPRRGDRQGHAEHPRVGEEQARHGHRPLVGAGEVHGVRRRREARSRPGHGHRRCDGFR
ncbi:MAG: tape measure protein [Cellulomonas sp.]|nr:tape measure protein [Cellulomonas sp.]MCR6649701.1 tape measure protein [Cellulomonas sp.]